MSDEDPKSSSGSEMNTAKAEADSLNTVQQMIVDQQQHLISHSQYDTNITSVENGKCYAFHPGIVLKR